MINSYGEIKGIMLLPLLIMDIATPVIEIAYIFIVELLIKIFV
jgi:hypothetical protein